MNPLISEVYQIIMKVKDRVTDDADVVWTRYENVSQLRAALDNYLERLEKNDMKALEELSLHFAPTSTFQELSISNGWGEEYMKLASKFDFLFGKIRNTR